MAKSLTSGLVVGYHGCERSVGESAIAGEHLKPSKNDYDWLGHGVYFWEQDQARTLDWAKMHLKAKEPFVVGAVIQLGYCLDLVNVEHLELLKNAYAELLETFKVAQLAREEFPSNAEGHKGDDDLVRRNLDCAVINYLHELRKENNRQAFETARSPFSEGKPLYPGAKIMSRTHVQICVRDSATIIGYFRPLTPT